MLRSQILYESSITPSNYEDAQRQALERALELQRRYEIIEATGWTFDQLDRQERRQVNEYLAYRHIKSLVEDERQKRKK